MSLASGHKSRAGSIMDRKIHGNPKYNHVSTRLNTGSSMSRYTKKMDDFKNNYKVKQGEIFKRMKCSTFVQLVLQVENYMPESTFGELSPIPDDDASVAEQTLPPTPTSDPPETHRTCDSRFTEVITGVGEMDSKNVNKVPETIQEKKERPYLLLDVRDKDAYDKCHIIGAVNFPSAMLSRAQNYFTPEVLSFINKEGKIIILYDEDERIAHACSTTMVERGVDNLFMLAGGLKVLNMKFPSGIIRGPLPRVCITDENGKIRKGCEKQDPTPACEHVNGNDFNLEDLEVLEDTLDKIMLSNAPPSRIDGMSRAQSMLSNRANSSAKAWK